MADLSKLFSVGTTKQSLIESNAGGGLSSLFTSGVNKSGLDLLVQKRLSEIETERKKREEEERKRRELEEKRQRLPKPPEPPQPKAPPKLSKARDIVMAVSPVAEQVPIVVKDLLKGVGKVAVKAAKGQIDISEEKMRKALVGGMETGALTLSSTTARTLSRALASKGASDLGIPKSASERLAKAAQKDWENLSILGELVPKDEEPIYHYARGMSQILTTMAPAIGVGVVGSALAAPTTLISILASASMAPTVFGTAWEQSKANGATDEEADQRAAVTALIVSALEVIGFKVLLMPGLSGAANMATRILVRTANSAPTEILTENIQDFADALIGQQFGEKINWKQVVRQIPETSLLTLLTTGVLSAGVEVTRINQQREYSIQKQQPEEVKIAYRAVDSVNKGQALGKGMYWSDTYDNAAMWGKEVEMFQLPSEMKILTIDNDVHYETLVKTAIEGVGTNQYSKMVSDVGIRDANGAVLQKYAQGLGYDGIRVADSPIGGVLFDKSLEPLTTEQIAEVSGGWQPGMKAEFDTALMHNDAATVERLLPQVPSDYKIKFADKIQKIIGAKPIRAEEPVPKGVSRVKTAQQEFEEKAGVKPEERKEPKETPRPVPPAKQEARKYKSAEERGSALLDGDFQGAGFVNRGGLWVDERLPNNVGSQIDDKLAAELQANGVEIIEVVPKTATGVEYGQKVIGGKTYGTIKIGENAKLDNTVIPSLLRHEAGHGVYFKLTPEEQAFFRANYTPSGSEITHGAGKTGGQLAKEGESFADFVRYALEGTPEKIPPQVRPLVEKYANQTKSQLTNIYNQAKGRKGITGADDIAQEVPSKPKAVIKEPKTPKETKEELVTEIEQNLGVKKGEPITVEQGQKTIDKYINFESPNQAEKIKEDVIKAFEENVPPETFTTGEIIQKRTKDTLSQFSQEQITEGLKSRPISNEEVLKMREQVKAGEFEIKRRNGKYYIDFGNEITAKIIPKEVTEPVKKTKAPITRAKLQTLYKLSDEFKANPVMTVQEVDGIKQLVFEGQKIRFRIPAEAIGIDLSAEAIGTKIGLGKTITEVPSVLKKLKRLIDKDSPLLSQRGSFVLGEFLKPFSRLMGKKKVKKPTKYVTAFHRTSPDLIKKIMREGLVAQNKEGYVNLATPKGLERVGRLGSLFRTDAILKVRIPKSMISGRTEDTFAVKGRIPAKYIKLDSQAGAIVPGEFLEAAKKPLRKLLKGKGVSSAKPTTNLVEQAIYTKETPTTLAQLDKVRPIQFIELVDMARELSGKVPEVKSIRRGGFQQGKRIVLNRNLFVGENSEKNISQMLAHEIGHLIDYLPQLTTKRGNLIARLNSLRYYLKNTFGDMQVTDKEMRAELKELTMWWKPWDPNEATPGYNSYRNSAVELYADAISVLFNAPEELRSRAPKFYEQFFANLDKKKDARDSFFKLQQLLYEGEESVLTKRDKQIDQMFDSGEKKYEALREEREKRNKDALFLLKKYTIDANSKLYELTKKAKRAGMTINENNNPLYYLQEKNYVSGKVTSYLTTKINPIISDITKNGITWDDFGKIMFLNRVISERGDLANPLGYTPTSAQIQLDYLKKQLGEEKYSIAEKNRVAYREAIKGVMDKAYKSGLYTPKMYEQIKRNPAYATFQVLDYLDDYIPASIKHQTGTLKEIANPATATLMKTISTIIAIERNNGHKEAKAFLEQSGEKVEEAKYKVNITTRQKQKIVRRIPMEPRDPQAQGLITYMENGKVKGMYVDPKIAESYRKNSVPHNRAVLNLIKTLTQNDKFRALYITFSPGFQAFNFIRDFKRAWKNLPGVTLPGLVVGYAGAIKPAWARAWSKPNEVITKMQEDQVLGSITFNDMMQGFSEEDEQIDRVLAKYEIFRRPKKMGPVKKVIMPVLEFIEKTGNFIETIPKVAGYKYIADKMPPRERASFIRTRVGSPDFLRKSGSYAWSNQVFMFSNAIKEGIRSDIESAFDPKTRAGFWWKTAEAELLPKLIMFAAAYGLMGDWLKKFFDDQSEYDKTNYTLVPLGKDDNGKYMTLRIPSDESGRFMGGLFWKILNAPKGGLKPGDVSQLLSYTGGQLPSISPMIEFAWTTSRFLIGKNPYDTFRGQNVLTDDEYAAGGKEALVPFMKWQWNQMGGGLVHRFTVHKSIDRNKTKLQMVLDSPIVSSTLGRFIKVSDYGQIERQQELKKDIQAGQAKERLSDKKLINRYVEEWQKDGSSMENIQSYAQQAAKEKYSGQTITRSEYNRFIKKFRITAVKGKDDTYVNSLIYANTIDEQLALLKMYRKEMKIGQFKDLFRFVQEQKIISRNTAKRFIQ